MRIEFFNPARICASGQIFRMYPISNGVFDVYSADRRVRLSVTEHADDEADRRITEVEFSCSEDEFQTYWRRFFDLDRDYISILKRIPDDDAFLKAASEYGFGIRVLHQELWETMVSFIISQQKQIPSIRSCIEGLCERFGEEKEDEFGKWHAFPTPGAIAKGGVQGLKGLSLGYRERYIYETAVQYLEHGMSQEKLEGMTYDQAKKYLKSFTGIGEKVANCILLFSAGFTDAFPIDTHIKDILYREYCSMKSIRRQETLTLSDYEALARKHFACYSPDRGLIQQWIFAYEINQSIS